jgi:hypothetical protein
MTAENLIASLDHRPVFCFTADLDWAPEEAIGITQGIFAEAGIIPTYFVTHRSEVVLEAVRSKRANGGIHPNFLAGSSHGEGFHTVADYFERFPPEFRTCYRSHRYFDVTDVSVMLRQRGYLYDSNHIASMYKLPPYVHFSGSVRFPVFWEDGTYLRNVASDDLSLGQLVDHLDAPGLSIMSVHPMHLAMNSPTLQFARDVKDRLSREDWIGLEGERLAEEVHSGRGIRDLFLDVLDHIHKKAYPVVTLLELFNGFCDLNGLPRA